MAIFRSRQGAEDFVADDPFVRNGVVRAWEPWPEQIPPPSGLRGEAPQ